MANEEYEILPHKILEDLKFDVEALKDKLMEPDNKAKELILEIENLKDHILDLQEVFDKALKTTDEEDPFKKMDKIEEQIIKVVKQNETIAKGMIAISDKVDELSKKIDQKPAEPQFKPEMKQVNHNMGMPDTPFSRMPDMTPKMDESESNFPPPPPSMGKSGQKKSLGSLFQ